MDATGTKSGTVCFEIVSIENQVKYMLVFFSYSGADIGVVCREALLRPIRRLGTATHFKRV